MKISRRKTASATINSAIHNLRFNSTDLKQIMFSKQLKGL
jgi:hypothetical protein